MVKMGIHLGRPDNACLAHKRQHLVRLLQAGGGPLDSGRARVHQVVQITAHKAVIDKKVFLYGQLGIS
jgi:hypothetical protein